MSKKLPKVLPGHSGGRLSGRRTKEKGRGEGEIEMDCEERRIKGQIVPEVVAGIKEKASVHEDVKSTAQSTVGQSVKKSWDCSHIENEEEEEEEFWQKESQMETQWAEAEKLEKSLEQKRMEGSSLKAEVMQKVRELVVHERLSQAEEVRGTKEKKKVKGWSNEEVKDKPNSLLKEDTEGMRKWRGGSKARV